MSTSFNTVMIGIALLQATNALAVSNGTPVPAGRLDSVVLLRFQGNVCSGVVVGNNSVLTARHCFLNGADEVVQVNDLKAIEVLLNSSESAPGWPGDLAMVKFETGKLPQPMPVISNQSFSDGSNVKLVGYGDTNDPAWNGLDLTKREGFNVSQRVPGSPGQLIVSVSLEEATQYDSSRPSIGLSGDSGGPLLSGDGITGIASETQMGFLPSRPHDAQAITYYVDLSSKTSRAFFDLCRSKGFDIQLKPSSRP